MYFFAILSLPLYLVYLGTEIGVSGSQSYIRGLVRGLFWFLPWILARFLFSSVFSPRLSVTDIYRTYTFSQIILPFFVLILVPLLFRTKKWDIFELSGKIGGFLFLMGLSETFVFPAPGLLSRIFYLPLLRVGIVYYTYLWLGWINNPQKGAIILSTFLYGTFLLAFSFVPVLEFQRLPRHTIIFIVFLFGLTFAMHNVRYLIQRTLYYGTPLWLSFRGWFQNYLNFYRKLLFISR